MAALAAQVLGELGVLAAQRLGHRRAAVVAARVDLRAGVEQELTARDDGTGAGELRPGGGLSGMRERLEELGGSLVVDAGGAGFSLRATVPA